MSKWKVKTLSAKGTQVLGGKIARSLKGGEIIELTSDLGGGKTTFTKGLAKGLGITEDVNSPTFVVSKVYRGQNFELHHYDFYRLEEAGLMEEEMQDVISDLQNITVVEWAGGAHEIFPSERLVYVELKPLTDETSREIIITAPDEYDEVLEKAGADKC